MWGYDADLAGYVGLLKILGFVKELMRIVRIPSMLCDDPDCISSTGHQGRCAAFVCSREPHQGSS